MAGKVATDVLRIPGSRVIHIVARTCPVTQVWGEVCQSYDGHSGSVQWCPFMYGLRINDEQWRRYDCRTPDETRAYMASELDPFNTTYHVLCLRCESTGLAPGATTTH